MLLGSDSNRSDFTKCIVKRGDRKTYAEQGQWVRMDIKKNFNSILLSSHGYRLDELLGFIFDPNDEVYTPVRVRLGYFESYLSEIIHRALGEMSLYEVSQVSFEIDPQVLDESLATRETASNQTVCLDLKFEIRLVEIEDGQSSAPIYELGFNIF